MRKLLHELYHGRIPGWDSQVHTTPDSENIRQARSRLVSVLSPEELEKFKALEALHAQSHAWRYEYTYTQAFRLGVLLMCAVFMGGGDADTHGPSAPKPDA